MVTPNLDDIAVQTRTHIDTSLYTYCNDIDERRLLRLRLSSVKDVVVVIRLVRSLRVHRK